MDDIQDSFDLFTETEKFIQGRPIVTIFHNVENLYSVIRIRVEETNEQYEEREAVVTGHFPKIHEEESYTFYGNFVDHPRFGLQFQTKHFKKVMPQTKQGVAQYLSSGLFKGIGKKTAERIVDELGENAIQMILQSPAVLEKIPRLSSEVAKNLYDELVTHQGLEQVMIRLSEYGFGPQISMKIYQAYKEDAIKMIEKNPYQLIEDVEGIGFNRADELGLQLGLGGNHPDRIKAGCLYMLEQESMQNGHVFVEAEQLLIHVKQLLENSQPTDIPYTEISQALVQLSEESKVVGEENRIYIPSLYYSEKGIVTSIQKTMEQTEYKNQFPESEFLLALGELENRIDVQYAPSQKDAIQTALMNPMMILTGGPGTGKTTVIKGIVELYAELHGCSLDPNEYKKDEVFPVVLVAPTGRAAKRMAESTQLPAMTIHRLLGMTGQESREYDEDHEIEGKLLIVDEMSMVDTWLAHQLLKALPKHIQVIFVGDEDQLPSVGPGQVLKDLLRSNIIPTVKLTDIYRQSEGSSIIELAHKMKDGHVSFDISKPEKDRSFIRCTTQQMGEAVRQVVNNARKKGFNAHDIQVLAPMYRGAAGINHLNKILQDVFNPNDERTRKEIAFGEVVYRIGDKVLQLVNQPEQNVFNGDMGEIISIIYAKENTEKQDMVIVAYEGTEVTYTRNDLNQITHAFCCSIHKSQGSEFPIVILPVVKSYYRMLRRNLLYTAITRSKQFLIILGEESAFRQGIEREDDQKRQTSLYEKLVEECSPVNQNETKLDDVVILTDETMHEIDPMIGMENISPYDFMTV